MIHLMIIYDVVNIFSMKNYKSSRKLRVGVNWYPGVNWSTTTITIDLILQDMYIYTILLRGALFLIVNYNYFNIFSYMCTKQYLKYFSNGFSTFLYNKFTRSDTYGQEKLGVLFVYFVLYAII